MTVLDIDIVNDHHYRIASDSDAGKTYDVRFDGAGWTCTCVQYNIQRNRAGGKKIGAYGTCKHVQRAQGYHAARTDGNSAESAATQQLLAEDDLRSTLLAMRRRLRS